MKPGNGASRAPFGLRQEIEAPWAVRGSNGEVGEGLASPQNQAPIYITAVRETQAHKGEAVPGPRLMTIRQLSDYLAVPVATLYTMRCLGRIPSDCIVRFGRSLRFDRQAVDRWIGERRGRP